MTDRASSVCVAAFLSRPSLALLSWDWGWALARYFHVHYLLGTPTCPVIKGVLLQNPRGTDESTDTREANRLNGKDRKPVNAGREPHTFWLPDQGFPNYTKLFLVLAAADLVAWRLYQKNILEFPSESPSGCSYQQINIRAAHSLQHLLGLSTASKDPARVSLMHPICPSVNRKSRQMLFWIFRR